MIKVEYSSNNSGGSWWLKDEDWKALEKAGWEVDWFAKDEDNDKKIMKFDSEGRWLGALAHYARKEFETIKEAIEEFEKVTGQDASDEGCNCCGAPHSFSWEGGYTSGDDVSSYLYGDEGNLSKRELLEKLKNEQ